ncbi:MAG TPA: lysylphosphatidylglycerol synthase domain-containing protein, partial [Phycisphaerae bacterium]|nr:lysylphosphatidylglycerol synthase domain-containing protein [Phycisphaerae bacterium]
LIALLLSARLRGALHIQKLYGRLPIARHLAAAGEAARAYRAAPAALAAVFGIALLTHLAWIVTVILVGRSLSIATAWPRYFIYVPLIYIIGVVPLAPGGWGLLEKCYVLLFASAAVGPTAALAMALLSRAVQLACGLSGLVAMAATGRVPSARAIRAELDSPGEPGGSGE